MRFEFIQIPDLAEHSLGLHDPIVGQLAPGLGVGDVLVAHPRKPAAQGSDPAVDRGEEQADPPLAQFLKAHDARAPALLSHAGLRFPNGVDGLGQVPVPFHGVEGQIKVRIDGQHGW